MSTRGQHRRDPLAQVNRGRWILQCLIAGQVDLPRLVHPDARVGGQTAGDVGEGLVQPRGVGGQHLAGVFGQAERGQHVVLDRVPLQAFEQACLGVAVAGGALSSVGVSNCLCVSSVHESGVLA